jgi:hypothetical protein
VIDTGTLQRLGLRAGEPVRFKKGDAGRWFTGKMSGVAVDGSAGLSPLVDYWTEAGPTSAAPSFEARQGRPSIARPPSPAATARTDR